MNSINMNTVIDNYLSYFKQWQNNIDDKHGIVFYLSSPIERLPKYKLFFEELYKTLQRNVEIHQYCHRDHINSMNKLKNELSGTCLAEKKIERLLITVKESINILNITQCYAVCQRD